MISLRATSVGLLCATMLIQAGNKCPPGFHQFQDSCYWFSKIKGNFAEARSYCGFLRSRLAVITSKKEDIFVRERAIENNEWYYLGATDLGEEGQWMWEGGLILNLTYTNWKKGEPNNDPGNDQEHCLYMGHYSWNDINCNIDANFICERCSQ